MRTKSNFPPRFDGFTIIELLVAVALIAIVSAIATPSWRALMVRSEIRSGTNDLIQALHLAKSEAIKQNRQVTVCPSSTGTGCTATASYDVGWIIKTGTTDWVTGDRILADYRPLLKITMTSNKNAAAITYLANGMPATNFFGMRVTIMENATNPNDTLTRYMCIAKTGRARIFTEEQYLALPSAECS